MFKRQWCCSAVLTVLALVVPMSAALAQTRTAPAPASKAQFTKIYSRLDVGGDLLVVANVEGVIEESIGRLVDGILLAAPGADAKTRAGLERLRKLPDFLKKNGLYAINGFGMSSVPRADGLNNVKTFIGRDATAVGTPFWRGLVGYSPRQLKSLDYLPAETVVVRAGNADIKYVWQLVRAAVADLAPPEAVAEFDRKIAGLTPVLGIDLETLIASLGDEGIVAIQFSRDTKVSIPVPGGAQPDEMHGAAPSVIQIPEPGFLIAIAVKDDTIPKLIEGRIAAMSGPNQPAPVTSVQVGDATVRALAFAIPQSPIPLQPALTVHGGFLIIGSTPAVVKSALAAAAGKKGLLATPAFKKAFEGLSMTNNGLFYVDPLFSKTVREVQMKFMGAGGGSGGGGPAFAKAMQGVFLKDKPYSCALVVLNGKDGVVMQGVTSSGAKELVVGSTIAPIGLMAAIAIPSFVKARDTSQHNACINNLRMLDSAKEQWAMEFNKQDGDLPAASDVVRYLRGGALPVCPHGGEYAINPVGVDPACSHHGSLGDGMGRGRP